MFKSTVLALAVTFGLLSSAFAGDQYIDGTGYAVSGYDVVSYFDMAQAAVGAPQPSPLPGLVSITVKHNGAIFAFATEANRERFLADPAAFVPQYDGHCAYGVAKGNKVPANPTLWRIVEGKLYLNISKDVVVEWEADIPGNLMSSEGNWRELEDDAAAARLIPDFSSAAPLPN